jgi:hypothetical protein
MTEYHVAVDHFDPGTTSLITTYLGTVDQAHVDEVRAIAELPNTERWVKEHPRQEGAFFVLHDDGDLDKYVPVDAPEFRIFEPDAAPKGVVESLPRGASTGPTYISGAVKIGGQSIGGAMDTPSNPARATWHTTESPGGANYFSSIGAYLANVASEPQVLYDPVTDKIGQYGPLNQSGRALKNDGSRRTNREGRVNIQVEVLARASSPWTNGFDPAKKPNYRKLIAAMQAWGIPDVWPAGKPVAKSSASMPRNRTTWQTKGGHYGHCHVPGNDHWDPGAIDTSIVPGKGTAVDDGGTDAPPSSGIARYQVTINGLKYGYGATGSQVTKVGQALVKQGCSAYKTGPGPDWTDADTLSYQKWQQKLGYSGSDADGVPGEATLKKLLGPLPGKAPAPVYEPFPGASFFHTGRTSPIVTAMGRRLVAEGCSKYSSGPGPSWTNADKASYQEWQKKLGYSGSDADGLPGKTSWDALKVPKGL